TTTTGTILAVAFFTSTQVTVTAADKPYDGTTSATLTSCTLSGVLPGDDVSCTGTGTATFDTAAVGTGKTVTVSGITLSGAKAGDYTLTSTTATTTAAISQAPLFPTVAVADKLYDGTTVATLTSCTVPGRTAAQSIIIAWDPNLPGDGVLGYLVRVGTAPGVYTQSFDVKNQTVFYYPNAVPGQEYFLGVAAYNQSGVGPYAEVSAFGESSGVVSGDAVQCTG